MNWENAIIIAMIAGQSLDIGSTYAGIKSGRCDEVAWPTQNVHIIAGTKAGATFVLAWGGKKQKGKLKKFLLGAAAATAVSGTVAGIHNIRECF